MILSDLAHCERYYSLNTAFAKVFDFVKNNALLNYELGKIEDNINEARFVNTNAKINLKGVKDENRGNFKSNLKIGFETGNFNFSLNGGYNTKDKNSQIGIGLGVSF